MASNIGLRHLGSELDELYRQLKQVNEEDRELCKHLLDDYHQMSSIDWESSTHSHITSMSAIIAEKVRLKTCRALLQERHDSLREQINEVSRPFLRRLTILDLPDEILISIFECFEDWDEGDFFMRFGGYQKKVIKSIRLTCQRFRDFSSHLLLPLVNVALNASSISRLEQISRHPSISKGVRRIQVVLDYFDSVLANDIVRFARHHSVRLAETTDDWDRPRVPELYEVSEVDVRYAISESRDALDAWSMIINGIDPDDDDEAIPYYAKILQQAQHEYRTRFEAQEELISDNTLVNVISSAFGRMPNAKRLQLCDRDYCHRSWPNPGTFIQQARDGQKMINQLTLPTAWDEGFGLGQPPVQLLFKLPIGISQAGGTLTRFQLDISPPMSYRDLSMSSDEEHNLAEALQRLELFHFQSRCIQRERTVNLGVWHTDQLGVLGNYLSSALSSAVIQSISLDLEAVRDIQDDGMPSLGSFVAFKPWQRLRNISLSDVFLDLTEFERWVNLLERTKPSFQLMRVQLLNGTWTAMLEILRKKSGYSSFIADPMGAECEEMSEEEKECFFGKGGKNWVDSSVADRYIRGYSIPNPLRSTTAEEVVSIEAID